MLAIVNQDATIGQVNLSAQFKKLVMLRFLTENTLAFLFQYMGLMFFDGLNPSVIAPLWFASGAVSAYIFMRGYSILPGILLGGVAAYFFTTHYILYAGISAVIDAMQAFLLLCVCYRYIYPAMVFASLKKLIHFILYCLLLTAITSAMHVLVFQELLHKVISVEDWLQWWLGNLDGILIFGCAIAAWDSYFPQIDDFKKNNKWELIFYYGFLLIIIITILMSKASLLHSLITIPTVILIGLRLGYCGVVAALLLAALVLNFFAYLNFLLLDVTFWQMLLLLEFIVGLALVVQKAL